jgi:hypothetical protein
MFDDILLLADGQILFHGPREEVCFSPITPKQKSLLSVVVFCKSCWSECRDISAPDLSMTGR